MSDMGERGDTGQTGSAGERGRTGQPGSTGERGDTGQRGVAGERGQKGDHGQHGETGATGKQGVRGYSTRPGVIAAFIFVFLAFLVVAFVLQRGRSENASNISRNTEVLVAQCREIEAIKKLFRDAAVEDFSKLDDTLKLLKLAKTPAIVARATSDRDDALLRFRARSCNALP